MKSDDLDTVALLKELLTINTVEEDPAETRQRLTLDFASLQRLLWSMDSEYDRKVTKGLLSALLPRQKLYHLGMKPDRVVANLQTIINTSQEAENAVSAAEDMVVCRLNDRLKRIDQQLQGLKKKLRRSTWSEKTIKDLESEIEMLEQRKVETNALLARDDKVSRSSTNVRREWLINFWRATG